MTPAEWELPWEEEMDELLWELIRDEDTGECWVLKTRCSGYESDIDAYGEVVALRLWGPYSVAQAEQIQAGHADHLAFPVNEYDAEALDEHLPAAYTAVAHLYDELDEGDL
jgi:hypothetical protein